MLEDRTVAEANHPRPDGASRCLDADPAAREHLDDFRFQQCAVLLTERVDPRIVSTLVETGLRGRRQGLGVWESGGGIGGLGSLAPEPRIRGPTLRTST